MDDVLDERDAAILSEVSRLYTALDPVPDGLVERVRFAMALEEVHAEVSRLQRETQPLAALARGDETTRTITFESTSLTIMINVSEGEDDDVRVDGWLAPPGTHRVSLRLTDRRLDGTADRQGRFVFDRVPRGLAQLIVRTDGLSGTEKTVATPSVVL
jgi:hypothetical protein